MIYLGLAVGFLLLVKGADYFVDGAAGLASRLGVPTLVIGLTVVAFGTSAPEAVVSIRAAATESSGISVGNVVGSNIFNIAFIIGLSAILHPLSVQRRTVLKEIPYAFIASLLALVLALDGMATYHELSRFDGLILLVFFTYFIWRFFAHEGEEVAVSGLSMPLGTALGFTFLGLVSVIVGGNMVVDNAIKLALNFGISETIIGLSLVAIGTSLPELVTSVTAALKEEMDIAIGNIVGSNIFNVLFVLGISSTITPMEVQPEVFLDFLVMLAYTTMLFRFSKTGYTVTRREGIFLLVSYLGYMGFRFFL